MNSLISVDEKQGVTREEEGCAMGADRDMDSLTVSSNQETVNKTLTTSTWQTWRTLSAWTSRLAIWAYRERKYNIIEERAQLFNLLICTNLAVLYFPCLLFGRGILAGLEVLCHVGL